MGCPTEVEIDTNLVFTVCTHDPATSILTDADAVPAYRVYEDETGTTILNGNMAKLDDAGTTGFYSKSIACTVANGFEVDKTYTVYITATVAGSVGGISYGFKAKVSLTAAVIGTAVWSSSHLTALRLALSAAQIIPGTVDDTAYVPNTQQFEASDITDANINHYKNRVIIITSGPLAGQAVYIIAYALSGGRGHFTTSGLSVDLLVNGDTFIII